MNFNKLARKINGHVEILEKEGSLGEHELFNRMAAFLPELNQFWNNTSDKEFMSLLNSYPYFKKYCMAVEATSEKEQMKESRGYDGLPKFDQPTTIAFEAISSEAAHIEIKLTEYQSSGVAINSTDRDILNDRLICWLKSKNNFLDTLVQGNANVSAVEYVRQALEQIAARLEKELDILKSFSWQASYILFLKVKTIKEKTRRTKIALSDLWR